MSLHHLIPILLSLVAVNSKIPTRHYVPGTPTVIESSATTRAYLKDFREVVEAEAGGRIVLRG